MLPICKITKYGRTMKRGTSVAIAVTAAFLLVFSSSAANASSLISDKAKKKKATPTYYAYGQDGIRVRCTIVGTEGKNKLVGTAGDDVICGRGGSDTIIGGGGNDIIDAGSGNDKIDGGVGDDVLIGGSGNDKEVGNLGADEIYGDMGNDSQSGGAGDDLLIGANGKDVLNGQDGSDELDGGIGKDTIAGGPGSNTCTKDTADRGVTGCYFDNSIPEVSDIRIEPAVIDTSSAAQDVAVYVTLKDETGGFPIHALWGSFPLSLTFSKVAEAGSFNAGSSVMMSMQGLVTYASCQKANRFVNSMNSMPGNMYKQAVTGCRVAGGRMDPVVRINYTIPAHSQPGRYRIQNLTVADAARNMGQYATSINWCTQCNNPSNVKFLDQLFNAEQIQFTQVGAGDTTPPVVSDFSIQPSVDTSGGDVVVEGTVRATDDYGFNSSPMSMQAINVSFQLRGSENSSAMNRSLWGSATGAMCNDLLPGMSQNIGCQTSPGVFKILIRVPRTHLDGVYELTSLNAVDAVGNNASYYRCQGCTGNPGIQLPSEVTITKSGFSGVVDTEAPQVIGFQMVKSNTNASDGYDYAEARVTVRENQGFSGSPLWMSFVSESGANTSHGNIMSTGMSGSTHLMTCAERDQMLGQMTNVQGMSGCLASVTGNDYVFLVPLFLPAHAPSGTWSFASMSISDGQNTVNFAPASRLTNGMVGTSIESVAGGIPTFTNSY